MPTVLEASKSESKQFYSIEFQFKLFLQRVGTLLLHYLATPKLAFLSYESLTSIDCLIIALQIM